MAVVGERADGHDHAAGAHAVLGSRPTEAPTVVVADPVVALGRLARHVLDRVDATVLALTGSQGKTGTKDYLAHVLAQVPGHAVVATAGNLNNELGVPLTVLRADAGTTHLVVEMGARGIGHIAYLCEIAPPRVAAVLNVGTAHLSEFGSREAIAVAKGEIVEALPETGVAVLNADDDLTAAMAARTAAQVLTVGERGDVTWRALDVDDLGRPSFELGRAGEWHPVRLLQSGRHQVANAAAAAAMALAAGLDPADVAASLVDRALRLALADGGPRARRRAAARQRRLQRQPRLDRRRAPHRGRDRRPAGSAHGRGARRDEGARVRPRRGAPGGGPGRSGRGDRRRRGRGRGRGRHRGGPPVGRRTGPVR